jgi:hypothetical protein
MEVFEVGIVVVRVLVLVPERLFGDWKKFGYV